jgi:zinc transporter, ZIP family
MLADGAVEHYRRRIIGHSLRALRRMLVGTMVPEAVEHAGRWVGLLTMVGFGTAFLLRAAT